jgi:UDP-glucose:(heptosyl)LPS alpha-1,3-glucosyltransferase
MKIALVIERMDPRRGGRERSVAQIASALVRRGNDVTILCQQGQLAGERVNVQQLGALGMFRSTRMTNFVACVRQAIQRDHYDIIHATLPVPGCNVYQPRGGTIPGQAEAASRRWKLAGSIKSRIFEPLNFHRRKLAQFERMVVDDQDVVCLAVSAMIAAEFEDHYTRRDNVRVIYNGVDIPEVDEEQWAHWRQRKRFEMGVASGDPVFISVATNFTLKGVDETIRAFAKWCGQHMHRINTRLIIVGRDLVEGYERIAGLLGVGRQVVFVPRTDDIFQWYAAADACILLSWYDPCSRTVLEALRLGIPSITTVYNGASEVISAGAGLVVSSPTDKRAIVAGLDELSDPERRDRRRAACLALTESVSTDHHVDELLKVYSEVVGAK